MNVFKISYLEKMLILFKEAFRFKKYKAMHPLLAVFSGILMVPFVMMSFFVAAFLFSIAFPFDAFSTLIKSLHSVLKEEGKEVKHATQVVIYWFSWPVIFFFYALECMLLLWMVLIYAFLSFLVYIWSFGGVRLCLFAKEENDISVEVEGEYKALPIIFVSAGYFLSFLLPLIHGLVLFFTMYFNYEEEFFGFRFFVGLYPTYQVLSFLFLLIFSLIMAAFPKRKDIAKEGEKQ